MALKRDSIRRFEKDIRKSLKRNIPNFDSGSILYHEGNFLEFVDYSGAEDYAKAMDFVKSKKIYKIVETDQEVEEISERHNNSKLVWECFFPDNKKYFVVFFDERGKCDYRVYDKEGDFLNSSEFENLDIIERGVSKERAISLRSQHNRRKRKKII